MRGRATVSVVLCSIGIGCLGLAVAYSGCGLVTIPVGLAADQGAMAVGNTYDKMRDPPPESEWNVVGVWNRVSDSPPTYLPRGFSRHRSRNEKTGVWVTDERDGKRLFVPHQGADGISHAVLMADARKATEWKKREPQFEVEPLDIITGGEHR